MKRSTLSAIFVASLVLTQHAQCAGAESAKGPLTAAEKARCRAQLTEFNQGVQAINAQLDVIKALDAEIGELSAAIDKERAAVDRRNSAAIQALNAQVAKNNELVKRHNQMASLTEAMSIENKQRAAQHYEVCENRPEAPSP